MLIPILLFLLGLILLIKGGDWFVDGSVGIARHYHVPELFIGATVVSIGTTLPEVMVSATSAVGGHGELAYGNAIGSVICNTALICAITCAVRPGAVDRKALKTPVLFFFASAVVYCLFAYLTGEFSRVAGFVLLAIFIGYMILSVVGAKRNIQDAPKEAHTEGNSVRELALLILGAAAIAFGAKLLVDNGTKIAQAMGVPESVIGLTFVALGTSLPELVTAITALVKGHSALSLGNIIGANLFNLVLVSGLSTALAPFTVPASKQIGGINSSLVVDLPLMLAVMSILCFPALRKGKVTRTQGIVLLVIYAAFCVYQFFG